MQDPYALLSVQCPPLLSQIHPLLTAAALQKHTINLSLLHICIIHSFICVKIVELYVVKRIALPSPFSVLPSKISQNNQPPIAFVQMPIPNLDLDPKSRPPFISMRSILPRDREVAVDVAERFAGAR